MEEQLDSIPYVEGSNPSGSIKKKEVMKKKEEKEKSPWSDHEHRLRSYDLKHLFNLAPVI